MHAWSANDYNRHKAVCKHCSPIIVGKIEFLINDYKLSKSNLHINKFTLPWEWCHDHAKTLALNLNIHLFIFKNRIANIRNANV